MPGLFSNAGEQLASSIENVGNAATRLGFTIYDKLNEAEAVSQFNVGQTNLQDQLNQADYARTTKGQGDFLEWGKQNEQAENDAWAQTEKLIKNPLAKKQLADWFQQQKIVRSKRVEDEIIGARINQLGGDFEYKRKRIINRPGPVDAKVTDLTQLTSQYTGMGVLNDQKAQLGLADDVHKLYVNDHLSRTLKLMNTAGSEKAMMDMALPENHYGISQDEADKNIAAAQRSYDAVLNHKIKVAKTQSEDSLTEVSGWIASHDVPPDAASRILGKADKDNLKFGSVSDGPDILFDGSGEQQKALKMLELNDKDVRSEAEKKARADTAKSEKPTPIQFKTYGSLYEKIIGRDSTYGISDMASDITKAFASKGITGQQYQKLLSLTGQAKNKDVAEAMGQLSKGLAHMDPVTGQAVGWYDSEVYGKLQEMVEDYVAAQHDEKGTSTLDAQKLHTYVDELTNKTMDAAIEDFLNGQYVSPTKFLGITFGEKVDPEKVASALSAFSSKDTYATGQGKSVMGVLKADLGEALAKKGITGNLSIGNLNGTIYPALVSGNKVYGYFTEKGTAVIKSSTDGKTWQTLK